MSDQERTGWLFEERYLWHDTGTAAGFLPAGGWLEPLAHAESPATKRRLYSLLSTSGLLDDLVKVRAREATVDELLAVHTREYVERIHAQSDAGGGDAGDGTSPFGPGGAQIARLSAGGVINAVDAVASGELDRIYALTRPPGHHAEAAGGMGFCTFNNIAVAIRAVQRTRGVQRVAVVDWDVHHGNGTQSIFYEDPDVLTISVHQDRCYPADSGAVGERGAGAGVGANLNIPLPAGSGEGAYVQAFERIVLPALKRFAPDLVIVASGLDASAYDPLARMLLYSDSYRELARLVLEATGGRVAVIHEGGYSPFYVPFCGLAVVETLAGRRTEVVDPFLEEGSLRVSREVTGDQRRAIDAAAEAAGVA